MYYLHWQQLQNQYILIKSFVFQKLFEYKIRIKMFSLHFAKKKKNT